MAAIVTTIPLTVLIPLGPNAHHCRWLRECLESVNSQSVHPAEILIIDDMHDIANHCPENLDRFDQPVRVLRAPWRLGAPTAANIGIALAQNEAVIILCADDMLLPGAIERAWKTYQQHEQKDALYWFGVRYSDGRDDQHVQWGGALVTKGLWKMTGGYSPQMNFGDGDAAFCSVLMVHFPDRLIPIDGRPSGIRQPFYWYRVHDQSNTATRGNWHDIMGTARVLVTQEWQAPKWGRYSP